MYSAENYLWGWVAYSTGALCLLFCLWLLVRKIGIAAIRHSILLLVTVALFTPGHRLSRRSPPGPGLLRKPL